MRRSCYNNKYHLHSCVSGCFFASVAVCSIFPFFCLEWLMDCRMMEYHGSSHYFFSVCIKLWHLFAKVSAGKNASFSNALFARVLALDLPVSLDRTKTKSCKTITNLKSIGQKETFAFWIHANSIYVRDTTDFRSILVTSMQRNWSAPRALLVSRPWWVKIPECSFSESFLEDQSQSTGPKAKILKYREFYWTDQIESDPDLRLVVVIWIDLRTPGCLASLLLHPCHCFCLATAIQERTGLLLARVSCGVLTLSTFMVLTLSAPSDRELCMPLVNGRKPLNNTTLTHLSKSEASVREVWSKLSQPFMTNSGTLKSSYLAGFLLLLLLLLLLVVVVVVVVVVFVCFHAICSGQLFRLLKTKSDQSNQNQEKHCTGHLQVPSPWGVCFRGHGPFSFCWSTI